VERVRCARRRLLPRDRRAPRRKRPHPKTKTLEARIRKRRQTLRELVGPWRPRIHRERDAHEPRQRGAKLGRRPRPAKLVKRAAELPRRAVCQGDIFQDAIRVATAKPVQAMSNVRSIEQAH